MGIAEYFELYILYVPMAVYGWGMIAFLLVLGTVMLWKGAKESFRYGATFLLAEYVVLLFYFTVYIWRNNVRHDYILIPFWSYWAMFTDTRVLMQEVAMNVAVFIPIGFLTGITMETASWRKVASVGFGISLAIELLQLVLKRGCCEIDDLINNTFGCLVGYGVFLLVKKVI